MITINWIWQKAESELISTDRIFSTPEKDFRYLWLKTVDGFNPSVHCAQCLKGRYSKIFGVKMRTNVNLSESFKEGQLLYFCGVSRRYDWNNNLHLAGKVTEGAESKVIAYTSDILKVKNLELIPIDAKFAESKYSSKAKSFLTCRNFQFGAQAVANGWL